MTPAAILRSAWALIEDPNRWTKRALACNSVGNEVPPRSPNAVCFCALGALRRKCWRDQKKYNELWDILDSAVRELYPASVEIAVVNDTLGHDAVRRVYARAIEMAEAGQ